MFLYDCTINKSCWHSAYARVRNSFLKSDSVKYQFDRQIEFRQRLHFQHEYTMSVGGRTYAWTLTYNNNALTSCFGVNVHDYRHVRKFLKSLSMYFQRHYGVKVEYAVFCELGEGKGERGEDANPHYHILCFFVPVDESNKNYVFLKRNEYGIELPSHQEVFKMAKYFWQGGHIIYDSLGNLDYVPQWSWELSKYGSISYSKKAKSGAFGFVTSTAALSYAVKYCTKDHLKKKREDIIKKLVSKYVDERSLLLRQDFIARNLNSYYFIHHMTDEEKAEDIEAYMQFVTWNAYLAVMRFVNTNYSPKPRCSMGIGHLDYVSENGYIRDGYLYMPDSSGVDVRRLLKGYFFRKYFYRVVKVENDKGKIINCYRPSLNYLAFRRNNIEDNIIYTRTEAYKTLELLGSKLHYDMLEELQKNAMKVEFSYDVLNDTFDNLLVDKHDTLQRYAIYKNIYEFRACPDLNCKIDYLNDFEYFLISDYEAEHQFYPQDYAHIQDFRYHNYFERYVALFYLLDLLKDYCEYLKVTNKAEEQFADRQKCINQNILIYES